MLNLDFLAAKYAPSILDIEDSKEKDKKEPLVNQALGILAEQGPFAMMLWAQTRCRKKNNDKKKIGDAIWESLIGTMREAGLVNETIYDRLMQRDQRLATFSENICNNFITLMMVRQLFDRVLIYARYYAKAEG